MYAGVHLLQFLNAPTCSPTGKFSGLMSYGSKDILKNTPCLMC